jgi:hypothetical protein
MSDHYDSGFRRLSAGNSACEIRCAVCGHGVLQHHLGRRREYHSDCKRINDCLTTLERLLLFNNRYNDALWAHDTDHLLLFRRRLQMLINSLPTASRQPRDEKGRWICSTQ